MYHIIKIDRVLTVMVHNKNDRKRLIFGIL